ncbi:14455_t:CDS:2 [Dentiscutata heterogama]|uniref:14455_t:CDS:1 n=1 Tax=Dentiscutata heterogama TaxID=1316150 RepID=A0ACA9JZ16_9GLOM|nr:14455_t:CDS:2 [Dentiscutata heterogama]
MEIIESSSPIFIAIDDEDEANENETSSNEELEFVLGNKLFIKLSDGTLLPAKCILPNDYCVIFKMQREAGAGTQLANAQDFIKLKAEYSKLATRKSDESNLDDSEDYERPSNAKKMNQISSFLSLSSCDKDKNLKESHVEINFTMLSIWAIDTTKGLATIEKFLTHPLFSHFNTLLKKSSQVTLLQEKPSVLLSSLSSMQLPLSTQPILSSSSYFQTQVLSGLLLQIQAPFVLLS